MGADGKVTNGADQQRVAIRRRLCCEFSADYAAGAAAIVDDHLLAKRLGKFGGNGSCHKIGGAARTVWHNQAQWPGRKLLRRRGRRQGRNAQHRSEKVAKIHAPIIMPLELNEKRECNQSISHGECYIE